MNKRALSAGVLAAVGVVASLIAPRLLSAASNPNPGIQFAASPYLTRVGLSVECNSADTTHDGCVTHTQVLLWNSSGSSGGGGSSSNAEVSTSSGLFLDAQVQIPWDNTQPQGCTGGHTEGELILTTNFVATSVTTRFTIAAIAQIGSDGVNAGICYVTTDGGPALKDTVSVTTISTGTAASSVNIFSPHHFASNTSVHAYNLCCAINSSAGHHQINGATVAGGATFAGYMNTAIQVREDGGGGSSGGGGSGCGSSDPSTCGGWTPSSGTATITAALTHVTGIEHVDGTFVGAGVVQGAVVSGITDVSTNGFMKSDDYRSFSGSLEISPSATHGLKIHTTGARETCNTTTEGEVFVVPHTAFVPTSWYGCTCTVLGTCAWTAWGSL